MSPQGPHTQTSILAAHVSEAGDCQRYKDSVNCFSGYLDPPNLAVPLTPSLEQARSPNFSNDHSASTETLIASPDPPKARRRLNRKRSSSKESTSFKPLVFTPAQVYPVATSRSTASSLARQSVSSPLLLNTHSTSPPPYSKLFLPESLPEPSFYHMNSDSDDDRDEDEMIYTSRTSTQMKVPAQGLRSRIFGLASRNSSRIRDKTITTTPGVLCAGETETETDEPSRHLPTSRIIPSSKPLIPPNTFEQWLTPLLFEISRLLSIVPAIFGTLYNLYHIYHPPTYNHTPNTRPPPERVDYFISALWAILTGYQCLCLTTGLLTRWRLYYPPLSTLVRLLALQGICWPATQLTLTILEHEKRPVICWAVIGTTTCMSRSVQIWVTSNLWWEKRPEPNRVDAGGEIAGSINGVVGGVGGGSSSLALDAINATAVEENRRAYWKRWGGGGTWGGRRWDWKEVGVKCVLPAGIVYFVMAWADQLRREWEFSGGPC